MKVYQTNEIRNISLIGGKGSGKTTLAESVLMECGVLNRRGTVDAGNTLCDYFPVEKEYGYSVFSTVFYAEYAGKKLNMIDCPGSDDFVGGAVTALSMTEAGALVVDAQYGVEVGTQNTFRTVARLNKPLLFIVNKCDAEKADFENVLTQLRESFGNKVVPVQYPVECGPGFKSVIDVMLMKQLTWEKEGGKPVVSDIPANLADQAEEYRMALLESAAENDEELMWSTTNPNVATVSAEGVVHAIGAGTATITLLSDKSGKEANTTVTVKKKNTGGGGTGGTDTGVNKKRGTLNLGYASYSGDTKNGKMDGAGVLTYKQRHAAGRDFKTGEQVYAEPGERVDGVWNNGYLSSGTLFKNNGNAVKIKY